MIHPSAVAEINSINQLLEIFSSQIFLQPPPGHFVKELTTFHVLHCKVYLGFASHDLVELHNVGVPHEAHHRDFALDLLHHAYPHDRLFVNDFDGNTLACLQVPCIVNFCKVALAKQTAKLILLHQNGSFVLHLTMEELCKNNDDGFEA